MVPQRLSLHVSVLQISHAHYRETDTGSSDLSGSLISVLMEAGNGHQDLTFSHRIRISFKSADPIS